jgi:nicotinamidase-related amidase
MIIDMQYYAAHREHGLGRVIAEKGLSAEFAYYYGEIEKMVPLIAGVLAAGRKAGLEVIHVVTEGRTNDGRDLGIESRKRGVNTPKGALTAAILPELAPVGDEIVVAKTVSGGFAGTGLDLTLRSLGIDTLIIAGVATNQCVENTVRAASNLGYHVVLLEDGCATYNPEWQHFSLESMADQFATVCRSGDVAAAIAALGEAA